MSDDRRSLFDSARALVDDVLGIAATRLELVAVEVQEEKNRILGVLALGAAALMSIGFGLLFLSLTITVLLWDQNRILVLGLIAAFFVVAGAIAATMTVRMLKATPRVFHASLEELKRDRSALHGKADE